MFGAPFSHIPVYQCFPFSPLYLMFCGAYLRNFLIDDKGVIVGVDLSPREVIRIVTGNRVAKAKPITNDRKELSHRIRRDNSFLFLGTLHGGQIA